MKTGINQLTVLALAAMALLSSCKKEEDVVTKNSDNKVTAQTIAPAMVVSSSISDVMDVITLLSVPDGSFKTDALTGAYSCATKTVDSSSVPFIYTFDFGSGCTTSDGDFRSGKVVVAHNCIDMRMAGSVADVNFIDFSDGATVTNGTLTITNMGANSNNNLVYSMQMNLNRNMNYFIYTTVSVITDPTAYCEWIGGFDTPEVQDDKFAFTGIFAGNDDTGEGYQVDVLTDLIQTRDHTCSSYFTSGAYRYKHTLLPQSIVDFGSGQCDNVATITTNGVTQTITLN